jgi:hypothetical protein
LYCNGKISYVIFITRSAVLSNVVFRANQSIIGAVGYGIGGAVYNSGDLILDHCVFRDNHSDGTSAKGGAIYNRSGSLDLKNSLLYQNLSGGSGDSIYFHSGELTALNCTIASHAGDGIYINGGTASITNSILWDNNGTDIVGSAILSYCDIADGTGNGVNHNISTDPMFVTNACDYRLERQSPCVNAGTNMPWMKNAVDLDGNPRIRGKTVDMGPYEAEAESAFTIRMH